MGFPGLKSDLFGDYLVLLGFLFSLGLVSLLVALAFTWFR